MTRRRNARPLGGIVEGRGVRVLQRRSVSCVFCDVQQRAVKPKVSSDSTKFVRQKKNKQLILVLAYYEIVTVMDVSVRVCMCVCV